MPNLLSAQEYVDGVRQRDTAIIGRTITLVESAAPAHRVLAQEVLRELLPEAGRSWRIGITGPPGVGKSTLIDALGLSLLEQGHALAVLAVDPTSERSGGSILGDKTRMESLAADPRCFIRPSPSGGVLGGVASRTRETMIVLEAAGFDLVLVETVGVGQSEVAVRAMVDAFVLLVLPGSGDELQGVKRGIMELADILVVTKSDGDNRVKAETTRLEHERGLHYLSSATQGWITPALCCSALERNGLDEVWKAVSRLCTQTLGDGSFHERRKRQQKDWLRSLAHERILTLFMQDPRVQQRWPQLEQEVADAKQLASGAAEELARLFLS